VFLNLSFMVVHSKPCASYGRLNRPLPLALYRALFTGQVLHFSTERRRRQLAALLLVSSVPLFEELREVEHLALQPVHLLPYPLPVIAPNLSCFLANLAEVQTQIL
jgi:hypothetical protein